MEPFWEKGYRNDEEFFLFGGGKPSSEIVEIVDVLPKKAKVLDMGCGDGRNAIFLAQNKFDVTAFDISEYAIEKLNHMAEKSKVQINSFVADMTEYEFDSQYDLVITHGCLHLLSREQWTSLIENIKANTLPNGYNIHAVFTDSIEPPEDLKEFCLGLFKEGELFKLYSDWKQILVKSYNIQDHHAGGIHHRHSINKIVACNVTN